MKTENTLENKTKFFAQYWGQTVRLYKDEKFPHSGIIPFDLYFPENTCLLLKPLSKISDEDLLELINIPEGWEFFKIYNTTRDGYSAVKIRKLYDVGDIIFNEDGYKYQMLTLKSKLSSVVDCLRSKGYALPYMDLSVEDLIDYGWIKLEEND